MLTLCCVAATAVLKSSVLLGPSCVSPHFIAGPHFAAVNSNNEIIVTDFHNHSVKVLSARQLLTPNCFYREFGLVGNNTQHLYRHLELSGSDFTLNMKVLIWTSILVGVECE